MSMKRSLQWGRNLSVAEPRALAAAAPFAGRASMGPQPFSRGNYAERQRDDVLDSMLQWGRNLSVAET